MAHLLLREAAIVYDNAGRYAARLGALRLPRLGAMIAPNGWGKTTLLSLIHPVLAVPGIIEQNTLTLSLLTYAKLRPSPPAAGVAIAEHQGRRLAYAWTRVELPGEPVEAAEVLEKIARSEEAREAAKRVREGADKVSRHIDAIRAGGENSRENLAYADLLKAVEDAIDDGSRVRSIGKSRLSVDQSRRLRNIHISLMLVDNRVCAAMLYSHRSLYERSHIVDVLAAAWSEKCSKGPLYPLYYHPRLALEMHAARIVWSTARTCYEKQSVIEACREAVEGCTALTTTPSETPGGKEEPAVDAKLPDGTEGTIPLHVLGDGQRAALLQALLANTCTWRRGYRAVPQRLLLFDTPEAYTHPDLIELSARLIVNTVKKNNVLAIVATQSLELLRELLWWTRAQRLESEAYVLRLQRKKSVTDNTVVTDIGVEAIAAEEAYEAVEGYGLDIRKYVAAMPASQT